MNKATNKRTVVSSLMIAVFIVLAAVTASREVVAATFTVSNLSDSGPGSLRQAILDANSAIGDDTIVFQAGLNGTILLTGGELVINDTSGGTLTINGPGFQVLAVSGNNASRVFFVTAGDTVTISGLTLTGGNDVFGGGIFNTGTLTLNNSVVSGNRASSDGGGIFNTGTLTINSSTISGNTAGNSGGGIFNGGTLTITNSTISGNTAFRGGGIRNSDGTLTITNSTISGNATSLGGFGGGLYIDGGTGSISFSTIANNTATSGAGGGIFSPVPVSIKNSIIAGGDCFAVSFVASGVNYTTSATCSGLIQVTPAQLNLGPLQDNGGPTLTHALLAGSVAIDAVSSCLDLSTPAVPISTDQRGVPRPQGPACDAGAYEVQVELTPDEMVESLIEAIQDISPPLHSGIKNSLLAKLNNALAELAAGDTDEARDILQAFINEVRAQAGKKISQAQAGDLIEAASRIIDALE